MDLNELKNKAASLPLLPGVYIMCDSSGQVIYIGKAKKLRNRVSQYFLNTQSHTPKTKLMVSKVDHFDVIIAATEFEALVLECSLIKRHMPKYNILLKDDKGYPYLRLDPREFYPSLKLVSRVSNDGAQYYGPYGSRGVTQNLLETLNTTLQLPSCGKVFPRDIGKDRPCLHYHMKQCAGWCQGRLTADEYKIAIDRARLLLSGNYKSVSDDIKTQMVTAAENLNFELAANLRDQLRTVEALGKKQLVVAGARADTDVIGFSQTDVKACFAVLHYHDGNLLDKDYDLLPAQEDPQAAVSSLLKQYYLNRGYAPQAIFLPFFVEDGELFETLLLKTYSRKTTIRFPQRGDNARLVELACRNALEEAERVTSRDEKLQGAVRQLAKMLSLESLHRIESYDISNISGTDIVASMVVYQDGKPKKSDYKHYKLENMITQDDYASMQQVITRRFVRYLAQDAGFEQSPDLLLIDGGVAHAEVARVALQALGLSFPVFGMVKDDRHRTRALVTPDGAYIEIATKQTVFALIGSIQEETHRFAISYHRKLRSKRLRYSELDAIAGIGPARKQLLLKNFHSVTAIKKATLSELERILPKDTARNVYEHFQNQDGEGPV